MSLNLAFGIYFQNFLGESHISFFSMPQWNSVSYHTKGPPFCLKNLYPGKSLAITALVELKLKNGLINYDSDKL